MIFHSSTLNHPEILHFTREKVKTLSMALKVVADTVMCCPGPLQNDLSLRCCWKCSWQMALSCQCLQGLPQLKGVTSPKVTEPSRAASDWMIWGYPGAGFSAQSQTTLKGHSEPSTPIKDRLRLWLALPPSSPAIGCLRPRFTGLPSLPC